MEYNTENFDEIIADSSMDDNQRISELLRIDCSIYCNLGLDSTQKENNQAKVLSRKIYSEIKKINSEMGDTFIRLIDKK